ncbi:MULTISPECIES: hypothetical protein [unclassified Enterococcus]|uniref:hypothetical protein n=1 Tax=unclassified Enterococcus TaxID=2608891 RepID=UPI001F5F61EB|nr:MULTISPECIES: hypothetical protein [unclassified Enterococcus]
MGDLFIGVIDETPDLVKAQGLVFFFDQKIQKQVLSLDHSSLFVLAPIPYDGFPVWQLCIIIGFLSAILILVDWSIRLVQQKNNSSSCQFLYLMEIQKHASFSQELIPFNSNHWSIPPPLTFSFNRFLNL